MEEEGRDGVSESKPGTRIGRESETVERVMLGMRESEGWRRLGSEDEM